MSVDMRERVLNGSLWIRLLFMLLYFVVVFEIVGANNRIPYDFQSGAVLLNSSQRGRNIKMRI